MILSKVDIKPGFATQRKHWNRVLALVVNRHKDKEIVPVDEICNAFAFV